MDATVTLVGEWTAQAAESLGFGMHCLAVRLDMSNPG
jgi:hypothetical protein